MKKFLILIALSSVFFFGTGSYNVSAKTYGELTTDEFVSYCTSNLNCDDFMIFENDYYRYFSCFNSGTSAKITTYKSKTKLVYFDSNSIIQDSINSFGFYKTTNFETTMFKPSQNTISYLNITSNSGPKLLYSTFDVLNEVENNVYFAKNYDYKKDTGTESSTVEFPYSREEFFLIPFFLAILICMLFFKWCFPMKGGKKI